MFDTLAVMDYTAPAMEGSNITVKCSIPVDAQTNNLTTTNYTTLTCMDGQWEPNLDQISKRCKGIRYYNC